LKDKDNAVKALPGQHLIEIIANGLLKKNPACRTGFMNADMMILFFCYFLT